MISSDGIDYDTVVPKEPVISFSKDDTIKAKELFIEVTLSDGSTQTIKADTNSIKSINFILKK